jgi:myo-inositol-1(or 4)-monophosphatase
MKSANFLSVAWEAASLAGALIRNHWPEPKSIDYKGAIDLVTSVDRECERRIVEVLRNHFSNHSILAEEETDWIGTEGNHRWIIDPLDGTTNFAHSYPQFCVSIALECNGEVILGLVYDPLRGECFTAAKGEGLFLTARPCGSPA